MSCAQPDCTRWSLTILPDSLRRPPHCHFILIILVISSLDVGVGSASILGGGSTSSSNIPGTSSSSSGSGGGASSTGVLGEQRSSPVLFDIIDRGSGPTGSGGGSSSSAGNYYLATEPVWVRNLDTQLLRLGSRLDQLMIRMDHLDSRVGRVQSQGHLRFDSIETVRTNRIFFYARKKKNVATRRIPYRFSRFIEHANHPSTTGFMEQPTEPHRRAVDEEVEEPGEQVRQSGGHDGLEAGLQVQPDPAGQSEAQRVHQLLIQLCDH